MRIGIDLMGGERSPVVLFQAIEKAVEQFPQVDLVIFVTQVAFDEAALNFPSHFFSKHAHVDFKIVSNVIEMEDEPLTVIRQKRDASLILGIQLLKKQELDGFVSIGNTGALIAAATVSLPLLPGIKRPALLATLPTQKGKVAIIDVGGNVLCKANHLVQFAQLGIAYQCCHGIKNPSVGLLNIGVESKKGTSEVRQTYELLAKMAQEGELDFVGNVEGREIFQGIADVIVTDGFTGNVLLKTSEGVSSFILHQLSLVLADILPNQRASINQNLYHQFDSEEYSGAVVCGIDGVVVKCHGQSSPKGLLKGIEKAVELVQNGFTGQIRDRLITNHSKTK